jgi:hypothetical protein
MRMGRICRIRSEESLVKKTAVFVGSMSVTCLAISIAVAQNRTEPTSFDTHTLIPVFSRSMDTPLFMVTYTQDMESEGDIPDLLLNSVMTIDGVEHGSPLVAFGGDATLGPGQTRTMRIAVSSYLPAGERLGYSQETERWRWKIRLADGRHRVSVRLGGEEYGPVDFFWDGKQSMNLLQEKPETSAGAR